MQFAIGIASTTHIDRQGHRMTKSALESMCNSINTKYIPQLIEHDRDKLIGVILYANIFQLEDGEYALGVVSGKFESKEESQIYSIGKSNTTCEKFKHYLNIEELQKLSRENNKIEKQKNKNMQKQEFTLADELENYLDSTNINSNGEVYFVKHFIASTGDLIIEVYSGDHNPPHFHVKSTQRSINARFHLETGEYLNNTNSHSQITEKDKKKIKQFLLDNGKYIKKMRDFRAASSH